MEQLVKVTTVPFQSIRFTHNARLVRSDNVDVERRKAIARHTAFSSRYSAGGSSIDMDYMNKVNTAFTSRSVSVKQEDHVHQTMPSVSGSTGTNIQKKKLPAASPTAKSGGSGYSSVQAQAPSGSPAAPAVQLPSAEIQAAYTMQRGSLELRVAKGELSFVPPLVMTIITQYPEIHFEYLGGFNYVPPRDDSGGSNMNLSI